MRGGETGLSGRRRVSQVALRLLAGHDHESVLSGGYRKPCC